VKNFIIITLLSLLVIGFLVTWFLSSPAVLPEDIRHIVLISIDTCRADYLSCYGYPDKTTPNIDRLARQGILFENVISPVPITLPAHSSMLTGTNPPYHGVHDNIDYKLGGSNVTLAEILKEAGFSTAAFISAFVLDSMFGLDQGFDTYHDHFDAVRETPGGINERIGGETNRYALQWLEKQKDERFFMFLHYFDPHREYDPPERYKSMFPNRGETNGLIPTGLYAGEIAYTDYCIGQVVKKLKDLELYESSLIIVTSDHGEMLLEHGEFTHSYYIYQSAVKVPMLFKLPGRTRARAIKDTAGLIDIVPTVCGLLGLEPPAQVQGKDLSGYFWNKNFDMKDRLFYCESMTPTKYHANPLLGVISKRWKYIKTTRSELYNLSKDPQEEVNLITQQLQQGRILEDELAQILKQASSTQTLDSIQALDAENLKRLESLGYVGTNVKESLQIDPALKNPKEMFVLYLNGAWARERIKEKDYGQAKVLCEEMLAAYPDDIDTLIKMGEIAIGQGNFNRALHYLQKTLKLSPDSFDAHEKIGTAYFQLGRYGKAVEHFDTAVQLRPEESGIYNNLGFALYKQGKLDKAIEGFKKSLVLEPGVFEVHNNLARVFLQQKKQAKAATHLRESLRLQFAQPAVLNNLAWIRATSEEAGLLNPKEAVRLAQRACELSGYQYPLFLNTLAAAYGASNRFDEAIETAQKALGLALSANQQQLADEIKEQLELYKSGQPYREKSQAH
jgi:arylsulfatase A-like enzyme/Flp pilus assembly protein TadD